MNIRVEKGRSVDVFGLATPGAAAVCHVLAVLLAFLSYLDEMLTGLIWSNQQLSEMDLEKIRRIDFAQDASGRHA